MSTLEVPMHLVGPDQEVEKPLNPVPDSTVNLAKDTECNNWVLENVVPLMRNTVAQGVAIRREWEDIRRMCLMIHDQNQNYKGMSNAYMPVYSKSLDTRVSHTARGLFPTDEYVDVKKLNPNLPDQNIELLKAWMQYQLDCQARVRVGIKPFLRQLFNYGLSVGKVGWHQKIRKVGRTTKLPSMAQVLMNYGPEDYCRGLRFETRSVFSWYIWPATVNHIKEATLVFEVNQVPRQYIREVGTAQGWENLEVAESTNTDYAGTDSYLQVQQIDVMGDGTTAANEPSKGELGTYCLLQEAYFNMPLLGKAAKLYRGNEQPGEFVPMQCILANGIPVMLRRNPYWFQHAPYVTKRINEMPDAFYGIGMGRQGQSLQYLVNDFMNQTNDNATYGLNPTVMVNPNLIAGNLEPLEPGRMWPVMDQNAIKFDRPPIEQMQYGMNLVSMLMSNMNDLLGTPPILQGSGARGAAKTATGAQLLQGNIKTDLQDTIEDIELEVLEPLMYMAHQLGQQFQSDEIAIATVGGPIRVGPGDLAGEYGFKWLASSQAANSQMRAQQAMTLLQVVMPLVPLLMQQGAMVNPIPLLRKIYSEGMGFRGFESFIEQGPQAQAKIMQMQMAQAGVQGGQPGQQVAGPEGMRSTVDQAPGNSSGSTEMVPGEGEGHADMRQEADMLAALMGGSNNVV